MKFDKISSLFNAINEGKVKQTDCISFDAQNKTFNSQGRAVRIVHDIGCFFAKGILKFITIKKLTDYIARHLDSTTVFSHNIDVAEFQNLKGKVTGANLKQILNYDNKEKLLTEYTDTISVPPEMENFLPENVSAKVALSESSKLEASLTTSDLNTALSIACSLGDIQQVKSSLERGADINFKNFYRNTALSIACSRGNEKIVELLLKKDLDINSINLKGNTALSIACFKGHEGIVKLLLANNPEINSQNNNKDTALMLACSKGNKKIVELLLAKKPDINSINSNGNTALSIACLRGDKKIVKLLLAKKPDINSINSNGNTALSIACLRGDDKIVKLLLGADADIDHKNKEGKTALDYAKENNMTVIEQLLQDKKNI